MGLRPDVEGRDCDYKLTDGHHRLMQALSKPILHNEYRLEIAEAALERRPRVLRQALNT